MRLTYSKELQELLKKKNSPFMHYGIGLLFVLFLLLSFVTPFIRSDKTYSAKASFDTEHFYLHHTVGAITPVTIQLTSNTIGKLKVDQKILFPKIYLEGTIASLQDTNFRQG